LCLAGTADGFDALSLDGQEELRRWRNVAEDVIDLADLAIWGVVESFLADFFDHAEILGLNGLADEGMRYS
jgi:hypothetical protein